MNEHHSCSRTAGICAPNGIVAAVRPAPKWQTHITNFIRDRFALWRMRAQRREEGMTETEQAQNTTARRQDKRPQCAARSEGCFRSPFCPPRQCIAFVRNVHERIKSLISVRISHIAECCDDRRQ